jgi:hypothetical protein
VVEILPYVNQRTCDAGGVRTWEPVPDTYDRTTIGDIQAELDRLVAVRTTRGLTPAETARYSQLASLERSMLLRHRI